MAWTSLSSTRWLRHWTCAEQRLGPALAELGRGEESVRAVAVEKTPEYAERRHFIGSRRS